MTRIRRFIAEAISELRKVSWPTVAQTRNRYGVPRGSKLIPPAQEGDLVAAVPGRLQAPASTRAIAPSAEARSRVFIDKGNATIPIGLRFRYHPAPEAGSPTLTPRASLEGVAVDGG